MPNITDFRPIRAPEGLLTPEDVEELDRFLYELGRIMNLEVGGSLELDTSGHTYSLTRTR